jgi:hypothetical protein
MVSLIDIVPQTRTVHIAAGELVLRGLGLRQVAGLLLRHPELRRLFAAGELDIDGLLIAAPDACGEIVAEAAGQPEAAEQIADAMPLDDVALCLVAVRDLTMPEGLAPFMDRLSKFMGVASGGRPNGKAPDTTMPQQPSS